MVVTEKKALSLKIRKIKSSVVYILIAHMNLNKSHPT